MTALWWRNRRGRKRKRYRRGSQKGDELSLHTEKAGKSWRGQGHRMLRQIACYEKIPPTPTFLPPLTFAHFTPAKFSSIPRYLFTLVVFYSPLVKVIRILSHLLTWKIPQPLIVSFAFPRHFFKEIDNLRFYFCLRKKISRFSLCLRWEGNVSNHPQT